MIPEKLSGEEVTLSFTSLALQMIFLSFLKHYPRLFSANLIIPCKTYLKFSALPEKWCNTWEPGSFKHPWCLLLQGTGSISSHCSGEISGCSFCPDLLRSLLHYWKFQHVNCDLAGCSREAWGHCWNAPHTVTNKWGFIKCLWIRIQLGWEVREPPPSGWGEKVKWER